MTPMKVFNLASTHGDRPANRLIAIGCVLMAVPFVLALIWLIVAVSPAFTAYRSRTAQPIPVAGPGEGLVIVAEFDGATNLDDQIDRAVTNAVYGSYNSTIYTGRSGRTITSHEDALELGSQYGAGIVVWGSSDGDTAEANISFAVPADQDEPPVLTLTLAEDDPGGITFVGGFLRALLEFHINPPRYGYWNGAYPLEPLLDTGDRQPVPVDLLAYYYALSQIANGQQGLALTTVENALDGSPPDSPIWPFYTRLLLQSGRVDDAFAVVDGLPRTTDALRDLYLDLLIQTGRYEAAAAEIESLLAQSPADRDLLMQYAALLEDSGDPAAAIEVVTDLLARYPDSLYLWLERARLYREMGDIASALADLGSIDPANSEADGALRLTVLQTRADLLLDSGDAQAALTACQELAAAFPASFDAQLGIGLAYWLMGDVPQARETWEALGWNLSNTSGIRTVALELARRGYPDPAAEVLQTALGLSGQDAEEAYVLAVIAFEAGDYDEAYRLYGEADGQITHVDTPYSPTFIREWADAALASGRTEIAIALYQRYLVERPSAPDAGEVRALLAGQ